MQNSKNLRYLIAVLLLIGCIGGSVYLAFYREVRTSLQYIIAGLLFIAGLSILVSIALKGSITYKEKSINATSGFAVLVILLTIFIKAPLPAENKQITIQLKRDKTSISNKEIEKIKIGSEYTNTSSIDINSNGEATYIVPTKTDSLTLELVTNDYQFVKTKHKSISIKIPEKNKIPIEIEITDDYTYIKGKVQFENKKLETKHNFATIIVKAITLENVKTKVDSDGMYKLKIPNKYRLNKIEIEAYYNHTYKFSKLCTPAAPCDITLSKQSK